MCTASWCSSRCRPGLDAQAVIEAVPPDKDVDGLHPVSQGRLLAGLPGFRPCTPLGVMRLLDEVGVELRGARAVVVGRSVLVGKPVALLLLERHATVTMCHSRTRDLAGEVGRADVVVAAVGQAGLVRGEWIRPGASSSTSAINRGADGKLCGDVEFAAARRARQSHHAGAGRRRSDDGRDVARQYGAVCRAHRRDGMSGTARRTPLYDAHRAARCARSSRSPGGTCRCRTRGRSRSIAPCRRAAASST